MFNKNKNRHDYTCVILHRFISYTNKYIIIYYGNILLVVDNLGTTHNFTYYNMVLNKKIKCL